LLRSQAGKGRVQFVQEAGWRGKLGWFLIFIRAHFSCSLLLDLAASLKLLMGLCRRDVGLPKAVHEDTQKGTRSVQAIIRLVTGA
jgi:hypothetical protein